MQDSVIKSVRRVFEIFELFDQERKPLAARTLADRLGYPLVSTHALLKSMYLMGYIDYDTAKRRYFPSRSLAAIADWVPDFLDHEQKIVDFARALNEQTQETINLSRRVGAKVRVVHGFASLYPIGVSTTTGTMMPLLHSVTGIAAISGLSAEDRHNIMETERSHSPDKTLSPEVIDAALAEIADRGSVLRCDMLIEGVGALCIPLQSPHSNEALVVGIVGPSERILEHADRLREITSRLAQQFDIQIGAAPRC